jgi:hypothetical protein
MLTVDRRQAIHRHFRATRDRQIGRVWWVEKRGKSGYPSHSSRSFSVTSGSCTPQFAGRVIKKCSLAVIGKVSAQTSRIQVNVRQHG